MSYDPLSPIQSQPRRQENTYVQEESQKRELVTRSGLQCLDDVKEVVLKQNVFYTRSGEALFGLYKGFMQNGPDLCFRDPYMKDLAALYLLFNGEGGKGGTYLRVVTPPDNTIGYVNAEYSQKMMNVSILMANNDLVFTSQLPIRSKMPKEIDIFSVKKPHVVAEIKLKEQTFSQVVFHFLSDMDVTLKMLVLAAFLHMNFKVQKVNQTISLHGDFKKIFIERCDVILENADNPDINVYINTEKQNETECRENRRHCEAISGLSRSHIYLEDSSNNCTDDDSCDCSCDGACCCCDSDCDDCNCDDICCGDLW